VKKKLLILQLNEINFDIVKLYSERFNLPNFKFIAIEEKDLPKELLNKIPGFPTILIQKDKSIDIYNGARSKKSLLSYLENL
jgi:hypothetical protein